MRAEQSDVITGDFWLGLDAIHNLTRDAPYKLRIELTTTEGAFYAAEYSTFSVGDEASRFLLSIGGYRLADGAGIGDVMIQAHNGKKFETWDNKNDPDVGYKNAASPLGGAFWYGEYTTPPDVVVPNVSPACRACLNSSPGGVFGWFQIVGEPLMLTHSKMLLDCR